MGLGVLDSVTSHRGGGEVGGHWARDTWGGRGSKKVKKCHVLFEMPLIA
jgi:hypothetical protein